MINDNRDEFLENHKKIPVFEIQTITLYSKIR